MIILDDIDKISSLLRDESVKLDFSSISILPLDDKNRKNIRIALASIYERQKYDLPQEYMRRTIDSRKNPFLAYPWAKSVILAAFPVNKLPPPEFEFPENENPCLNGLIAAYAIRKDYHLHVSENLKKLISCLQKHRPPEFKAEICVDTKPVSEKILSSFSGLGKIGRNTCLICGEQGAGIFIGVVFLELNLPSLVQDKFILPCRTCRKCPGICPTEALPEGRRGFKTSICRSYITMEKRGLLDKDERKLLGNWIFGCDICTSACPGTRIPAPFKLDLAWLLLEKDTILKKAIKNSALEYAGLKILRRNAIAVIGNNPTTEGKAIIAKFAEITQDEMLKGMSNTVLNEMNI